MQRERHAHLLWLFDAAANRCNALSQTPAMIINSAAAECGHVRVLRQGYFVAQTCASTGSQTTAQTKTPRQTAAFQAGAALTRASLTFTKLVGDQL
jgi:hypothetical protein